MYENSKYGINDKIEQYKSRLNASNIVQKDSYEPNRYWKQDQGIRVLNNPMINTSPLITGDRYDSTKEKVQREVNTKLNLSTEKRELELMIQDQIEAQMKLKDEYGRQIEATRAQIEHIEQMMEEVQKDIENKMEKRSKLQEENNNTEAEINEIIEENKMLENEIDKLGKRTTQKMGEMQEKMEGGLHEYEGVKGKNQDELKKFNDFLREKIQRMENEYNKKVGDLNDKYNESLLNYQQAETELQRLQDEKKRAEVTLQNKLKAIKEQYYDEEFNKFRGTLKIYQNRLRNAIDNKEALAKKKEQKDLELENMKKEMNRADQEMNEENQELDNAIGEVKTDIETLKKEVDLQKNENYNQDAEIQRIQSEIQKNKFAFKQIGDNCKYRIKEIVEKNKNEIEHLQSRVQNQHLKVQELDEELKRLQGIFDNNTKQNQRMLENMKSQLNKNIYQTINEYKDIGQSQQREPYGQMNKERSFHQSQY